MTEHEKLVERLRSYAKDQGGWHNIDETCEEAATALTLANERIARLEEALRRWQSMGCPDCGGDCASANPPVSCCIMRDTRAALKGGA